MAAKKILVVDDEAFIVRMLTARLTQGGYLVVSASDGQEGVEVARRERPDLIVMDWCMPRMDGIEATRQIKGDPGLAHIPVLMLTCKGQEKDEETARAAGVVRYVTKPFHISRLKEVVDDMLR
jgi:CheY-like chemotaxis protein